MKMSRFIRFSLLLMVAHLATSSFAVGADGSFSREAVLRQEAFNGESPVNLPVFDQKIVPTMLADNEQLLNKVYQAVSYTLRRLEDGLALSAADKASLVADLENIMLSVPEVEKPFITLRLFETSITAEELEANLREFRRGNLELGSASRLQGEMYTLFGEGGGKMAAYLGKFRAILLDGLAPLSAGSSTEEKQYWANAYGLLLVADWDRKGLAAEMLGGLRYAVSASEALSDCSYVLAQVAHRLYGKGILETAEIVNANLRAMLDLSNVLEDLMAGTSDWQITELAEKLKGYWLNYQYHLIRMRAARAIKILKGEEIVFIREQLELKAADTLRQFACLQAEERSLEPRRKEVAETILGLFTQLKFAERNPSFNEEDSASVAKIIGAVAQALQKTQDDLDRADSIEAILDLESAFTATIAAATTKINEIQARSQERASGAAGEERLFFVKSAVATESKAALNIQRMARGFLARKQAGKMRQKVTHQAKVADFVKRREAAREQTVSRRAFDTWRGKAQAQVIDRQRAEQTARVAAEEARVAELRSQEEAARRKRETTAATKIQSFHRGNAARSQFTRLREETRQAEQVRREAELEARRTTALAKGEEKIAARKQAVQARMEASLKGRAAVAKSTVAARKTEETLRRQEEERLVQEKAAAAQRELELARERDRSAALAEVDRRWRGERPVSMEREVAGPDRSGVREGIDAAHAAHLASLAGTNTSFDEAAQAERSARRAAAMAADPLLSNRIDAVAKVLQEIQKLQTTLRMKLQRYPAMNTLGNSIERDVASLSATGEVAWEMLSAKIASEGIGFDVLRDARVNNKISSPALETIADRLGIN